MHIYIYTHIYVIFVYKNEHFSMSIILQTLVFNVHKIFHHLHIIKHIYLSLYHWTCRLFPGFAIINTSFEAFPYTWHFVFFCKYISQSGIESSRAYTLGRVLDNCSQWPLVKVHQCTCCPLCLTLLVPHILTTR